MGDSYVLLTLCYTRYDIGSYIYIPSSQGSQVAILRRQRTTRTASSANLKLSPQGRSYVRAVPGTNLVGCYFNVEYRCRLYMYTSGAPYWVCLRPI